MAKKRRWPKNIESALAHLEDSQSWAFKVRSAPSCSQAVGNLTEAARRYGVGMDRMKGSQATNAFLLDVTKKASSALVEAEEKTVRICSR